MTLSEKQLKELKNDLLQLKNRLEKQAEIEDKTFSNTDEVTFSDNHLADNATEYVDKQTHIAESNLNDEQLQEVNDALERMEKGRYGICIDSGKEIAFERLKAIPYAKRTIQAEEDHQNPPPANEAGDTSRMVNPQGDINDSRDRTLERIEEEHE